MFHRLVAEAFCENPNGYTIVDHIDRDKHNDNASNLRWVDQSTNAKNCERNSRKKQVKYTGDFTEKNWYPVWEHENYMISEDCDIVSLKTNTLMVKQERHGYYRVCLDNKYYSVHKMLWEALNQESVPEGMEVDHIDGDKNNNSLFNLRLVSHSENMKNSYANGHKGQVPIRQYSLTGELLNTYPNIREAAKDNNLFETGVRAAALRHGASGGYYWLFEKDETPIDEVVNGWVPEGFTIIPEYLTYCINEEGQVYNKRRKDFVPVKYRADGKPYVVLQSKRINIDTLKAL